ncbi:hypothetical protein HDV00_006100 [Rhizophlyctis rosea]|nr:hypothetical protein HDV00_006100 [Rhizophlyctis rosea]
MESMISSFPVRPIQPQPAPQQASTELDAYLAGFQAAAAALAKGAGPLLHVPTSSPTTTPQTFQSSPPSQFDFQLASAAAAAAQQAQSQPQQHQWHYANPIHPAMSLHQSPPPDFPSAQSAFPPPTPHEMDMFLANAVAAEPTDLSFLESYEMEQELNLLTEHILDTSMCEGADDEATGPKLEANAELPLLDNPSLHLERKEEGISTSEASMQVDSVAAPLVPPSQPTPPAIPTPQQTNIQPPPADKPFKSTKSAPAPPPTPIVKPLSARPAIPPRPNVNKPPTKKAKTTAKLDQKQAVPLHQTVPVSLPTSFAPTQSAIPPLAPASTTSTAPTPVPVPQIFQFGLPSPGSVSTIPLVSVTATLPNLVQTPTLLPPTAKLALPRLTKPTPPPHQATQQIIKHQRKVAHNAIERRYRNNINDRIAELRSVVPALNGSKIRDAKGSKRNREDDSDSDGENDLGNELMDGIPAATRLNKATILRKSTEYILHLKARNQQYEAELHLMRTIVERLGGSELLRNLQAQKHEEMMQGMPSGHSSASSGGSASPSPPPSSPDPPSTEEEDGSVSPMRLPPAEVQNQGGMKFMAVMMMCACVLWAPSPFEDGRGAHVHAQGRVLEERGLDVGGGDAWAVGGTRREMWVLGTTTAWAVAKFVFVVFCMFNFAGVFSAPGRRRGVGVKAARAVVEAGRIVEGESGGAGSSGGVSRESAEQQLGSLTGRKSPTSRVGAFVGILSEGIRFLLNHFCGVGSVVEWVLRIGDGTRGEYFRAVGEVSGRVLGGCFGGATETSDGVRLYHSLRTINFVELAERYGTTPMVAKTYLLTALHLRIVVTHSRHSYVQSLFRLCATYFWRLGVEKTLVVGKGKVRNEKDVIWFGKQDREKLEAFFESGEWIADVDGSVERKRKPLDAFADRWRLGKLVTLLEGVGGDVLAAVPAEKPNKETTKLLTDLHTKTESLRLDALESNDTTVLWYTSAILTSLPSSTTSFSRHTPSTTKLAAALLQSPLMDAEKRIMAITPSPSTTSLSHKLVLLSLFTSTSLGYMDRPTHIRTLKALTAAIGARRKELKNATTESSSSDDLIQRIGKVVEMCAVLRVLEVLCCRGGGGGKMEGKVVRKAFMHVRRLLPGLRDVEGWVGGLEGWQEVVRRV